MGTMLNGVPNLPPLPVLTVPEISSRILVVDDHEDSRSMLCTWLEMNGFSTLEADNCESAECIAHKESPDLILMDLGLPTFNGIEIMRRMREQGIVVGDTPIVFVTAWADTESVRAAFDAGCDDLVIKPIDLDRIVVTVRQWLARAENSEGGGKVKNPSSCL